MAAMHFGEVRLLLFLLHERYSCRQPAAFVSSRLSSRVRGGTLHTGLRVLALSKRLCSIKSLADLPSKVLVRLLPVVPAKETLVLARTCKRFHKLIAENPTITQK